MTIYHHPVLTAVAAKQWHQAFQREAKRWQAAGVAAAATKTSTSGRWTQLKRAAVSKHASSAHRLSAAARRVEVRLPSRRATPSGA